jgi:hypothetical protein
MERSEIRDGRRSDPGLRFEAGQELYFYLSHVAELRPGAIESDLSVIVAV